MSRSIRVSILLAVAIGLVAATGAMANIPDPTLSNVPDGLTISPGTLHGNVGTYSCSIQGPLGPVNGAKVIVEVAPDADPQVAWCIGQTHPIQMDFTDASGAVSFTWQGGGCMDPNGKYNWKTFIVHVTADNVTMAEPFISSPDVVNSQGRRANEIGPTGSPIYEQDPGDMLWYTGATLADAVEHTAPIQLGTDERCSKLSPDPVTGSFLAPVGLSDAVELTPYIQEGTFCQCQYP